MERLWLGLIFFAVLGVVALALVRLGKRIKKDKDGNFIGFNRECNTDSGRIVGIGIPSLEGFFMGLAVIAIIFTSGLIMLMAGIMALLYKVLKKWDTFYKEKAKSGNAKIIIRQY